jgi:hypothetical protein
MTRCGYRTRIRIIKRKHILLWFPSVLQNSLAVQIIIRKKRLLVCYKENDYTSFATDYSHTSYALWMQ